MCFLFRFFKETSLLRRELVPRCGFPNLQLQGTSTAQAPAGSTSCKQSAHHRAYLRWHTDIVWLSAIRLPGCVCFPPGTPPIKFCACAPFHQPAVEVSGLCQGHCWIPVLLSPFLLWSTLSTWPFTPFHNKPDCANSPWTCLLTHSLT